MERKYRILSPVKFFGFFAVLFRGLAALEGDECIHFSYFSNLVEDYANGACHKANFFAEWIYLPNAYGDKTFEDIEERLLMLDRDEELTQQQKHFICYFIFPNCASKQKQIVYIDTPLYEPRYHQRAIRFCATNAKLRIQSKWSPCPTRESGVRMLRAGKTANKLSHYSCPETFTIHQSDFDTSADHFLKFVYCIQQRADLVEKNNIIMKIYKIGQSVKDRDLVAVEMWADDEMSDLDYKSLPESRLMGNIHGNEDQGVFVLSALINHYSVATEDTNSEIFELLKHLRLHVLISLNPDGHWMSREAASTNPKGYVCWLCGRNNHNNVDLNRNFPYLYQRITESEQLNKKGFNKTTHVQLNPSFYTESNAQPETISIIRWSENHNFVMSAMLHSGAWVFNYPYDTSKIHPQPQENPSDDQAAFQHIGANFTASHQLMRTKTCDMDQDEQFDKGMTNGAAWYSLRGTLQDYGYIGRGIMEVTLEMGCEKTVHSQQTMAIYGQNKQSLFDFLWHTYTGFHGIVTNSMTYQPVENAEIFITACTKTNQLERGPCSKYESENYAENKISAITGSQGQFYKVYYPKDYHNYICLYVTHIKYQPSKPRCYNKYEIDWERPEVMEISSRRAKKLFFELEPKSRRTAPNMG